LLVLATSLDTTPAQGATYLHANFSLSSDGEYLGLVDPAGQVVSEFTPAYPVQNLFYSCGRDTNGNWGFLAQATPAAATPAWRWPAPAPPQFSAQEGFHSAVFSLAITSATAGATIRHTVDGSEPNPGLLYVGPITISTDRIVRARAVKDGAIPPMITHTFLLFETAAKSPPALCLGGDPVLTYYGPNTARGGDRGRDYGHQRGDERRRHLDTRRRPHGLSLSDTVRAFL
jgi:hypothetical protein